MTNMQITNTKGKLTLWQIACDSQGTLLIAAKTEEEAIGVARVAYGSTGGYCYAGTDIDYLCGYVEAE